MKDLDAWLKNISHQQQPDEHCPLLTKITVNVARFVLGAVLVFSGYVKAVDPLGSSYKLEDYEEALGLAGAVPGDLLLAASIALATLEFCVGIFLLFAIQRRRTSVLALLFMAAMTAISIWLVAANPVKDCGCFGDAIHLTNGQSLAKNIVLLVCAVLLWRHPAAMYRFISKSNQWIAINYVLLFAVLTSLWSLYDLPIFDFRPYHVGVNIKKAMEIPPGAPQPKFETTFILEKKGVRKEFTLDNYPDSTWTFIDSKTVQTAPGYVPPISDFYIQDAQGNNVTDELLNRKGYVFLLISPSLAHADDSNFGAIDQIYEYCQDQHVPFYCLTASPKKDIDQWQDMTGAEYPFLFGDATVLKTIIRSNPGLMLIKDGTIIGKWSHNFLPDMAGADKPLAQTETGQAHPAPLAKTLGEVLLWFFMPLLGLTAADRLWAWTKWLRRWRQKREKQLFIFSHKDKKGQNNEKENRSRQLENE